HPLRELRPSGGFRPLSFGAPPVYRATAEHGVADLLLLAEDLQSNRGSGLRQVDQPDCRFTSCFLAAVFSRVAIASPLESGAGVSKSVLLEPLTREAQGPPVLGDGAHYVLRSATRQLRFDLE